MFLRDNTGLHKGDARSDKIARRNDVPTIGVLGNESLFAMRVQICKRRNHHVAFGAPDKETSWVIAAGPEFLETMKILQNNKETITDIDRTYLCENAV